MYREEIHHSPRQQLRIFEDHFDEQNFDIFTMILSRIFPSLDAAYHAEHGNSIKVEKRFLL